LHSYYADHQCLTLAEKEYVSMVILPLDHVGLIMAELKAQGFDYSKVVVFTSDSEYEF